MNHGFLVPQFGLGRSSNAHVSEEAAPTAKTPWGPTAPTTGPTVTFKRRRLVEGPDVAPDQVPSTPAKAPKVFTLQPATRPEQAREPESFDSTPVEAEHPSAPKARRRRDPSRQPTLVQHVVFQHEPPVAEAAEPDSPGDNPASATRLSRKPVSAKPEADPLASTRRREAAIALDAHFKRLGF